MDLAQQRAIRLKSYYKNREVNIAKQTEYRRRVKEACYAAYGGYRCNCCGITEKSVLCLDHINNDGYANRKVIGSRGGIAIYLWLIKNKFPDDFQVLCYNCNQSKRINGGICFHQLKQNSAPSTSIAFRLEL